jgi:endonuclease-3
LTRQERTDKFIEYFTKHQPRAETELYYENPFQLLVAVILSAQCTDKRINMITPALFQRFPSPQSLARADVKEVFEYIRSVSYPNNKANHLVGMARMLVEEFGGKFPDAHEDLVKLPGVGRKTANVITSVIFDQAAIAVDTHVFRVSARIGLTINAKSPLQTEQQLNKYIPQKFWSVAHHWLILHGRYICTARNPKCRECPLLSFCKTGPKFLRRSNS